MIEKFVSVIYLEEFKEKLVREYLRLQNNNFK